MRHRVTGSSNWLPVIVSHVGSFPFHPIKIIFHLPAQNLNFRYRKWAPFLFVVEAAGIPSGFRLRVLRQPPALRVPGLGRRTIRLRRICSRPRFKLKLARTHKGHEPILMWRRRESNPRPGSFGHHRYTLSPELIFSSNGPRDRGFEEQPSVCLAPPSAGTRKKPSHCLASHQGPWERS